jgi:hypothetical protein
VHPVSRTVSRTVRAGAALAVALSLVTVAGEADEAAADDPACTRCDYGGDTGGGSFSAWGAYAGARGGESGDSTTQDCWVDEPDKPHEGRIVVHVHGNGDPSYFVFIHCMDKTVADPLSHPDSDAGGDTSGDLMRVIDLYTVEPVDPQAVVDQALAQEQAPAPEIRTVPGDGNAGLVGVPTWLMVENMVWERQETTVVGEGGLVSVTVWAEPVGDGEIVWNTGEGTVTCAGDGTVEGSCSYTYQSSSLGQEGVDGSGRPAYPITASVTYTGGYDVYLDGTLIASADLGEVVRTSEPVHLAVQEAQAINTGG